MIGPREIGIRSSNWVGGAECGDSQCLDHDTIEGFPKWAVDFISFGSSEGPGEAVWLLGQSPLQLGPQ